MYKLNLAANHAESLLGLINHDNASTIVSPLTLEEVSLQADGFNAEDRALVTVTKKAYPADNVQVNYTKLNLGDFVEMHLDGDINGPDTTGGDFSWYKPDQWENITHKPLAIAAFKQAAAREGIDLDAAAASVEVTRVFDEEANRFFLEFSVVSYVWHEKVSFGMPKHFSEVVTVQDLNGFIFEPISADSVVE